MINGITPEQASKSPAALAQYLTAFEAQQKQIQQSVAAQVNTTTTAPAQGQATVVGQDGHFTVTTKPGVNASGATLYYQVQSSDNLEFDVSGNVLTYGGDNGAAQTTWTLPEPNETRFIRWKSKTANSAWSAWTYYSTSTSGGPFAVWSGLLRSVANVLVNQACTPSGGNPLTQDGTTTNIKVAASSWTAGTQTISYLPGNVDPGVYGLRNVYCDDPKRKGGAVTYQSTSNSSALTASDYRVWFGSITTAAGGGGTGAGGGSGACLTGECLILMSDGTTKKMSEIRAGDLVFSIDGGQDRVEMVELFMVQPCFRITLANAMVMQGCSSFHLLKYSRANWVTAFEIQEGDELQVKDGTSIVTKKEYIGDFPVYRMSLDRTRAFFADGLVNHNMLTAEKP